MNKYLGKKKKKGGVWNSVRWQTGLKATLLAVEEGCPLNNNHCYTSKTFPHPLAIFTQAFICSLNRTALAKRLEDIISLLAPVI